MPGFYALLKERIEEFRANPPPADWDGVFVATEK
jgi:adenylate cyclase